MYWLFADVKKVHTTNSYNAILDNLLKFTNYSITVLAFTSAGDGASSQAIYCHTDEDGKII